MITKYAGGSRGTKAEPTKKEQQRGNQTPALYGPVAPTLTDKKHGVGPHDEVWEVQPLYDVVVEASPFEPPRVICRDGSGKE